MKFNQLIILENLRKNQILLESVCDSLTGSQSRVVRGIYGELRPLIEASLTQDQISQLFAGVDKSLIAQAYREMSIEDPFADAAVQEPTADAKSNNELINTKELINRIKKLDKKSQEEILFLLKS